MGEKTGKGDSEYYQTLQLCMKKAQQNALKGVE
jgi:hypothetical protein